MTKPPSVRGDVVVKGRLPPEVIQRVTHQSYGRFRLCYENGLRKDPSLSGVVSVVFVIARDGSVASVGSGPETTLPEAGVVSCVTKGFYGLSFPQPEGGVVKVTSTLSFSPGEPATPTLASKWRILGKPLAEITADDLERALKEEGCQVTNLGSKPGVTRLEATRNGSVFTVTFVPATIPPDALDAAESARLKEHAAVLDQEHPFLAIEHADRASANELLSKIAKPV